MKTRIKNFQILKDVELEFNPGITAIVGDSNNGKSSIIRAIEYSINNKGGSGFINYDSKYCDVTIEDNDHIIKWHKDEASRKSYYEIDGKKLSKIGQKQLDEVGELLNMPEIEVSRERFRLNFWKQMEYPFLVGKTAYQLFDFISRSEEQELMQELKERSEEEYKALKKDKDTIESQIDLTTSDISDLKKEVKGLEKFVDYDLGRLKALLDIYELLDGDITQYSKISSDIILYKEDKKIVIDKIEGLDKLFKSIDNLYKFRSDIEPLVVSLDKALEDIEFTNLEMIGAQNETELIKTKIKLLKEKIDKIDKLSEETKTLEDFLESYRSIKHTTLTEKSNIVTVEGKIKDLEEELSEFKVCPLCGGSLEGDECIG